MKPALPGAVVLLASGLWLSWPWIVLLVTPVPPSSAAGDLMVVLDGGSCRFDIADRICLVLPLPASPPSPTGCVTSLCPLCPDVDCHRSRYNAHAVILGRVALCSQCIRVGPAYLPTPSFGERRKLLRDAR